MNGTTQYVYHGWRLLEERDGTGAIILRQYVYGNGLDEVWTMDDRSGGITVAQLNDGSGAQRHFMLSNVLGSVTGLTNEAGGLVEAWQYDAYGRHTLIEDGPDGDSVVSWSGDDVRTAEGLSAAGNTALFTGQRWDAETGLHYYKNRYYSADRGRFVVGDSGGAWFDERNYANRYTYVSSAPQLHSDPHGREGNYSFHNYGHPSPQEDCFDCEEWLREELSDQSWLDELPNCPCHLTIGRRHKPEIPNGWRKDPNPKYKSITPDR